MQKFLIVSRQTRKRVEVEYNDNQQLCRILFEEMLTDEQLNWMLANVPRKLHLVAAWRPDIFDITIIPEDISFETFWDTYNKKIGKEAAVRQWNKLSSADRAKAIRVIPKYQTYCRLQHPPRAIKDAERYLSNRTFDDQFNL